MRVCVYIYIICIRTYTEIDAKKRKEEKKNNSKYKNNRSSRATGSLNDYIHIGLSRELLANRTEVDGLLGFESGYALGRGNAAAHAGASNGPLTEWIGPSGDRSGLPMRHIHKSFSDSVIQPIPADARL